MRSHQGTGPSGSPAITVSGLRKAYAEHTVLDGVDLHIPQGTVFSLLGPNGAGKTTAVKILSTLTPADAGQVTVAGHDLATDPDGVRGSIGVTGQFSAVDQFLNAEENLELMGRLWHLDKKTVAKRRDLLIEQFDLVEARKKPVATFSGGMKRRLDLAMTLVGSPSVIFLDEPTTGLDPRVRRSMWELIRELVAGGVTIFLTTQYLEEADQLADSIAVLNGGRIVAEGTAEELKRQIPGGSIDLQFVSIAALDQAAAALAGTPLTRDEEAITLRVPNDGTAGSVQRVLNSLDTGTIHQLSLKTPDLDDVFLALTGTAPTTTDDAAADAVDSGADAKKKVLA